MQLNNHQSSGKRHGSQAHLRANAAAAASLVDAAETGKLRALPLNWVRQNRPSARHVRLGPVRLQIERASPGWYWLGVGSPGWGLNRFRSGVLPALVNDLKECISVGASTADCGAIADLGQELINLTPSPTTFPLVAAAWKELHGFAEVLNEWRHFDGGLAENVAHRWAVVFRLREERQHFADFVRMYQGAIASEVTWSFLDKVLESVAAVASPRESLLSCTLVALRRLGVDRARKKQHPEISTVWSPVAYAVQDRSPTYA